MPRRQAPAKYSPQWWLGRLVRWHDLPSYPAFVVTGAEQRPGGVYLQVSDDRSGGWWNSLWFAVVNPNAARCR